MQSPAPAMGAAQPRVALIAGIAFIVTAVLLTLPFNPIMSAFLFLGAFIYVAIYTLWLKPRTSLNIVIGGLAGSGAVLSGSAAGGDWAEPAVLLLAALLSSGRPSTSGAGCWSIAMHAEVGIPMLPVTASRRRPWCGAWRRLRRGIVALLLALQPGMGLLYLIPVLVMTVLLLVRGTSRRRSVRRERLAVVRHPTSPPGAIFSAALIAAAVQLSWPF